MSRGPSARSEMRRLGVAASLAVALACSVAAPAAAQEGLAGPAEGESLAQWTERWLDGPVQLIATSEEKELYASLQSTHERLQFIRLFWQRRDPRLRGERNEFLEEFARRLAYVEERFADDREPAWKTVFGQVVLLFGPPDRTRREIGGIPQGFSDRPPILWSYDRRLPGLEPNEDLLFVYRAGRWRLMPPYPIGDGPIADAAREMERSVTVGSPIPGDYRRAMDMEIQASLVNPVNYRGVIDSVRTAIRLPEAQIPFGYELHTTPRADGTVQVGLEMTWRIDALVFHLVEGEFVTDMVIDAQLSQEGEVRSAGSLPVQIRVPEGEMEARRQEIVRRTLEMVAPPGEYELEIVLFDQLLGYRSVYRDRVRIGDGG